MHPNEVMRVDPYAAVVVLQREREVEMNDVARGDVEFHLRTVA